MEDFEIALGELIEKHSGTPVEQLLEALDLYVVLLAEKQERQEANMETGA
jgi:hypothetical protein